MAAKAAYRPRGQTVDQSISISRTPYVAFAVRAEEIILYREWPWFVAQADHRGRPITATIVCRCESEARATFIAESLSYTLASLALAKHLVLDTLEI